MFLHSSYHPRISKEVVSTAPLFQMKMTSLRLVVLTIGFTATLTGTLIGRLGRHSACLISLGMYLLGSIRRLIAGRCFFGILFTKNALQNVLQGISAERTRFELVVPLPVRRFSKPVDSATLPPLQSHHVLSNGTANIRFKSKFAIRDYLPMRICLILLLTSLFSWTQPNLSELGP